MYEIDTSIIERSNVQTDVVVVNQCDNDIVEEFDFKNKKGVVCHAKFINTTERGLSRSRNMAIANSWGDICYICDDDEWLEDDYEENILEAYEKHPNQDVMIFKLIRKNHSYPEKEGRVSFQQILRTSSVQITFKRNAINYKNISFDIKMGSGTGNGGGEEVKFLLDCKRKHLKVFYVPSIIAIVLTENSQWFHGFDEKYFRNMFWSARRSMGSFIAFIYIFYWCLIRSRYYPIEISKLDMLKYSFKGYFEKRY